MSVFRSLFIEHPASVNETYLEHLLSALSFGTKMLVPATCDEFANTGQPGDSSRVCQSD